MKRILLFLMLVAACTTVTAQTVRDRHNSTMGKVESNGTVRDRNNSTIGKVEGVSMRDAAVIFFFDFFGS